MPTILEFAIHRSRSVEEIVKAAQMRAAMLGTMFTVVGCSLAILGGCLVFQNAAPDVGEGRKDVPEFFRNRREALNRFGFGFLTLGSKFQMMGVLMSGFFPN
jgi:hypothetical protein